MSQIIHTRYCNSISRIEAECIGRISREEEIKKQNAKVKKHNYTKTLSNKFK